MIIIAFGFSDFKLTLDSIDSKIHSAQILTPLIFKIILNYFSNSLLKNL